MVDVSKSIESSMVIKGLKISPPLFLAPMAGLTHSALRALIAEFGGVGLYSTEMLSARSLPVESPRHSPYLITTKVESPLSYQLLAGSPEDIPKAVERVEELGAAAVDLNLGCGAPKVRRLGCGMALWEDMERLKAVVKKIRSCTSKPFTAKIRLGPKLHEEELKARLLLLQDLGVDCLYLHARLDKEPFSRRPRWEWAAKARLWLDIPLVVNGGIFSVEDARRCLEVTGANGLMIGRASAISPWIFSVIASRLYGKGKEPDAIDLPGIYEYFFNELVSRFPKERQIGRLKEFTHYFSRNYPFGNRLAMAVQRAATMSEALEAAQNFFEKNKEASLVSLSC